MNTDDDVRRVRRIRDRTRYLVSLGDCAVTTNVPGMRNPYGAEPLLTRGVLDVARHYIAGDRLGDGMLNRVEAVIRCFDPCLTCSTHAVGQMPLHVQLVAADGSVVDELRR